eukprot:COSAG01_NODE_11914_length_1836_cov_1.716753_1_plen_112_part_10
MGRSSSIGGGSVSAPKNLTSPTSCSFSSLDGGDGDDTPQPRARAGEMNHGIWSLQEQKRWLTFPYVSIHCISGSYHDDTRAPAATTGGAAASAAVSFGARTHVAQHIVLRLL